MQSLNAIRKSLLENEKQKLNPVFNVYLKMLMIELAHDTDVQKQIQKQSQIEANGFAIDFTVEYMQNLKNIDSEDKEMKEWLKDY